MRLIGDGVRQAQVAQEGQGFWRVLSIHPRAVAELDRDRNRGHVSGDPAQQIPACLGIAEAGWKLEERAAEAVRDAERLQRFTELRKR